MILRYFSLIVLVIFLTVKTSFSQDSLSNKPVIIEAESGTLGSGFSIQQDGDISFVTANSNYTGQTNPGDSARLVTLQVTFQDSGNYNLFARVLVGSGGFNDDSFFAGKGFGEKSEVSDADWVFINGLASAGFTKPADYVSDLGTSSTQIWKWVNLTKNFFASSQEQPFYVGEGNLTQVFQIGSREDGLCFDKFAFGKADLYFTVEALDSCLEGSAELFIDSSKIYLGPPLAVGSPKFLGNLKGYNDTNFANMWNQLTPENEGKWGSVASVMDTTKWNWGGMDALYKYSLENDIIFKFHTLIWGAQQPAWISTLAADEQLKYIESWIRKVGEKYPETEYIDVVNEALPGHNPPDGLNDRANYKEALGGNGVTGWDWVIKSFELARKYLPNTKLLLNDFGIINDNSATNSYLKIINLLNDRGLIDGIGVQGHRFEFESASLSVLKSNLDKLSATGLPVYITEFDLGNLNDTGTPDDNKQLELYQRIFPVLWNHPGVRGITLWGYKEGMMWQKTCHLVLSDGTWRPALKWLAQYIKDNPADIVESVTHLSSDKYLGQNYPNPFNYSTSISFNVSESEHVSIKVYDTMGRNVATIIDSNLDAGTYNISWNAMNNKGIAVSNGTYLYQYVSGNKVITKKMLIIK